MPRGNFTRRSAVYPIGPSIAYIPLSRGLFCLVDWDTAKNVEHMSWFAKHNDSCGDFRAARCQRYGLGAKHKCTIYLHQCLLGPLPPGFSPDHVNGNSLDNRMCNLRAASVSRQLINRRLYATNTSGYKGVRKKDQKWEAEIAYSGRRLWLGTFSTPEEAHSAYCEAAAKYHGDFARAV